MLVANVATARLLEKSRLPALYRVHDGPREQKLESLRKFLAGIGIDLRGGDKPSPADYQAVLEATAGRPDAHVIQTVMLRSLSQAVYQPDNRGHFGLNYPAYAHFTSPIRRYPDLLVHRAIRSLLLTSKGFMGLFTGTKGVRQVRGARRIKPAQSYPYTLEAMQALGEHCSQCERRADEATRDVMAWLKCEYLQDRVGDEFSGVITAVTSFGLFVELKDIYVEGLVHVSSLGQDYFQFDAAHHRLVGERTRKVYRLGDAIRVRVVRVSLDERKIDLEAVLPASTGKAADKSSSRGGRRGAGGKGGDAKSSKAEQGVVSDKTGAEQGEKSARPRRRSARGRRR